MNYEVILFLREQRHIFGICPYCATVFRLSDVHISYKAPYKRDWLDRIEEQEEKAETALDAFEDKRKGIHQRAIERARMKVLPKLLQQVVPMFAKQSISPQDVKTLLHPIDFVVFDGMNGNNGVKRVILLDNKPSDRIRKGIQQSIEKTLDDHKFQWLTVRIDMRGNIDHSG